MNWSYPCLLKSYLKVSTVCGAIGESLAYSILMVDTVKQRLPSLSYGVI